MKNEEPKECILSFQLLEQINFLLHHVLLPLRYFVERFFCHPEYRFEFFSR
ncbi:hypothetical protein Hanom_Chr14g01273801 [Helianthus anomalus]